MIIDRRPGNTDARPPVTFLTGFLNLQKEKALWQTSVNQKKAMVLELSFKRSKRSNRRKVAKALLGP